MPELLLDEPSNLTYEQVPLPEIDDYLAESPEGIRLEAAKTAERIARGYFDYGVELIDAASGQLTVNEANQQREQLYAETSDIEAAVYWRETLDLNISYNEKVADFFDDQFDKLMRLNLPFRDHVIAVAKIHKQAVLLQETYSWQNKISISAANQDDKSQLSRRMQGRSIFDAPSSPDLPQMSAGLSTVIAELPKHKASAEAARQSYVRPETNQTEPMPEAKRRWFGARILSNIATAIRERREKEYLDYVDHLWSTK